MLLKCIKNDLEGLPNRCFTPEGTFSKGSNQLFLTLGKAYVVYAITNLDDMILYYISDDINLPYPIWHPINFFEVVNGRPSKYWKLSTWEKKGNPKLLIAFEEWINDRFFYEKLVDGNRREEKIFERMKKLMDIEERILLTKD